MFEEGILTKNQFNEAKEKILERMAINNVDKTGIEGLSGGYFPDPKPGDPPPGPCDNLFPGETCGVYTTESFLSSHGLKPKDLSPMLLELGKKTQETVPACTTDFCFTMQPQYATDEIINKAALINA